MPLPKPLSLLRYQHRLRDECPAWDSVPASWHYFAIHSGNYFPRIPFPAWMKLDRRETQTRSGSEAEAVTLRWSDLGTDTHRGARKELAGPSILCASVFFTDYPADNRGPMATSTDLDAGLLMCFPRPFPERPLHLTEQPPGNFPYASTCPPELELLGM